MKTGKKRNVSINKAVRKAIVNTAERKVYISGATGQNAATGATVWPITQGIIQGDTVSQRGGSQVTLQHISLKVHVFMPTAAVAAAVRILMVIDHQNLSAYPLINDVLAASTLYAPYSIQQSLTNRFRILHDTIVSFTAGGEQTRTVTLNSKARNKITYFAATDIPGANGKGAAFFIILTDAGVTVPTYDFNWSVQYLDM